ncbi:MAG: CVNH domain-containing protein [Rhizonema sp. PD37]|nr:CVNH domain-containing protein [Rhizonema sp. PD37]
MSHLTKRSLSQALISLTAFSSLLVASSVNIPSASALESSSFQRSCKNISIAGDTLSARCRRANRSFNNTSILTRGIENNNGKLVFTNLNNPSNFQSSCKSISISGDRLSARCRRVNGRFNDTNIHIPGIKNNNGNLTY